MLRATTIPILASYILYNKSVFELMVDLSLIANSNSSDLLLRQIKNKMKWDKTRISLLKQFKVRMEAFKETQWKIVKREETLLRIWRKFETVFTFFDVILKKIP